MARENVSFWQSLKTRLPGWRAEKRDLVVAPVGAVSVTAPDFGCPVDNDTALKNTALYAGIRLIAENIASLPKVIKVDDGKGGMAAVSNNSLHRILNFRPNSYTNAFTFWLAIVTWMKGWGNAYAIIKRGADGRPEELHQVHPSNCTVKIVDGRKWYRVRMTETALSYLNGVYSDDDMLHFMEMSLDGIKGINPVVYNAAALGKSLAQEKFAATFYRKGGNIKGVMEMDGNFDEDTYEKWMLHFKEQATDQSVPLLEYGVKYKQLSVDPVAATLVNSEIFSIQDVCRILNVPPHMIAELSHATFSNIEHQTIQFVEYCLRPIIKRIEVEIEGKMFFESEVGQYDVKFVLDGLLRGDTAARATFYHNAILDGYMSRNEVRALEGLEHQDGLDKFLFPANESVVESK